MKKMKLFRQMLAWSLVLLATTNVIAQAPANDACAGAIALTLNTPVTGDLATATADAQENALAAPACWSDTPANGGTLPTTDTPVWYTFTPATSGSYVVSTDQNLGQSVDTQIQLYTGTCGALTAVAGACSDDISGGNWQSTVTTTLTAGTTYYILLDGWEGYTGAFQITVAPNPICDNATCELGESYCTCSGDCPCTTDDIDARFVGINPATGGLALAPAGEPSVIRCASDFQGGIPPAEPAIYITLVYFGSDCIGQTDGANPPSPTSPWATATSNFGTVVNEPGTPVTEQPQLFIFFLEVTQADIDASGGIITITFGDETPGANCQLPFVIDLSAWGETSTLVETYCPTLPPCLDNAGTATGPSGVCFGDEFTITQTVAPSFDPVSTADGIFYALYTADGPTAGFENDIANDPNALGVFSTTTTNINDFGGGTFWIVPVTYEGTNAEGQILLGNCHHVGTGFQVTFFDEITIDYTASCYFAGTIGGGDGTVGYSYTVSGPSNVDDGTTTDGSIAFAGAPGIYTIDITDIATDCSTAVDVEILANNDSAGTTGDDITVCLGGSYSISTTGAVVGSDGEQFSNTLGWGISTTDPQGDIGAVDVAFIQASPADVIDFINNGQAVDLISPDGTPFTGSLTPGNTYYFTPFTMYDLPGTPLTTQTTGEPFGAGGDAADAAGTADLVYGFYVDGASADGSGFSIDNICLDISHAWLGDLNVYLISPSNTVIQIFGLDPNTSDDNLNACIVNGTGTDPAIGCNGTDPCYTGNINSLESLTLPAGENPNGFWFIVVDDTYGDTDPLEGGGTFNSWNVSVSGGTAWDANGNFPFPQVGDCYLAGDPIAVTLLTELTATATPDGCALVVSATGGDANNGFTFTVTDADDNEVATGDDNNSTVELTGNGNYTIALTDEAGCTASTTAEVTDCIVCGDITPTISGTLSICDGETTTLTASEGYASYAWTPTNNTQSITVSTAGTYALTVTDLNGCTGTASVTVNVNSNPTLNVSQSCNGTTADVTATGGTSYALDGGTAQASGSFTGVANGTHTITASNNEGCTSTQTFTVNCTCPTLSGIEVTPAAICSGSDVMVMGSASAGTLEWKYSTSATFDPYTSGTAYTGQALTAIGCTPSTYYLKAYITGVNGCQVSSDATAIMVYPAIQANVAVGVCGASVSITGGCDYAVTWSAGTQTGSGAYSTNQTLTEQNNSVTFTVTNAAAPAGCNTLALDAVTVNCPALVCATLDGTQTIDETPLCSGSAPMMVVGGVTNNDFTGGSVTWKYSNDATFDPYSEGTTYTGEALTAEGCDASAYYFKAILTGVSSCSDVSETFEVMVYPAIEAEVSNGFDCGPASVFGLSVDCGFDISWSDSEGNLGVGSLYSPETGAIGTVTFTIENPNAPTGCSTNIFEASYNCSDLVCSELDGTQSVTETAICSGQALTLNSGSIIDNDFTGGSITWTYSTSPSFNAYTGGTTFTGNLPANNGCSVLTYYVRARLDGVLGCNDQSAVATVAVYPSISATANNGTCSASVTANCAAFTITWATNTETGTSNTYNAAPGESGSVTFTVSNLSGAPATCATATATANYNCPSVVCSTLDGTQSVTQSNVCSGQSITTNSGGVNNGSFTGGTVSWTYGTSATFDAYTGTAFTGTLPANNSCNATTYYLKARLDGVEDCQDQSAAFMVMVYPQISNLVSLSSTACTATVNTSCAGLTISSLFNGATGSSNTVSAAPGQSGTVTFTISNAGAPVACSAATLTATLNCPLEPVCTPNNAGVCSLSYLNLNLANGRVDVCQGDGVQAAANGQQVNDADYAGGYILHNSPSGNLTAVGTIIYEYSTTGEFINNGSYPYNTPLYVSAAVLLSPFGSSLSGECSAFSNTEEVRFYQDITASTGVGTCNYNNNTYTVSYTLSGGDGTYTADGGMVMGTTFTTDDIAFGEEASYTISSNGCTFTIDATHDCGNQPSIDGNLNFVLSTATATNYSDNLSNYVSDADGDNLTFAFNTVSPSGSGTLTTNPNGSFTFTPADGFTGTVTIPFSVSDGNTPAVSGVITISVSDQILSCDQLPAISIVPAITVNPISMTYNAWYYITGGLPSADGSNYSIALSDDAGFTQTFTGAGNSVFQANNLAYTIDADSTFFLTITATDNLGCTASLQVPVYVGLDVAWLSFTGEVKATGNELKWITASEVNNDYFTLERSSNGTNFTAIATIDGKGNTNTASAYTYLDKEAPAGMSYYRISQTNFDGTRNYGGTVTLVRGETTLGITTIYPVPATHNVTVKFVSAQTAKIQANTYDAAGRLMNTQNINATGGENTLNIDVANYPSGVYFVKLNNGTEVITTNFVKQ